MSVGICMAVGSASKMVVNSVNGKRGYIYVLMNLLSNLSIFLRFGIVI